MPSELDQEQNNRIQAFVATYNVIDSELRRRLKRGSKDGFVEVLRDARSVVGTSDFELLNTAAQLRNFLIHDPKRPYDYVAVPTSAIVDRPRIIPACGRSSVWRHSKPIFERRAEATVSSATEITN